MTKIKLTVLLGTTAFVVGAVVAALTTNNGVEITASASGDAPVTVVSDTPMVGAQAKLPISLSKRQLTRFKAKANRVVKLEGVVGQEINEMTIQEIYQKGKSKEPLVILINSPGGSVMTGNQVLSAMDSARGPVYTVCLDLCASMAAVIHQHGTKRYALDRSTLMFHNAAGGMSPNDIYRVQSRLNYILRILEKTDRVIAKKAGMTYEAFRSLNEHELWLDAEDAFNLRFVDSLISLELEGDLEIISVPSLEEKERRKKIFGDLKKISE